MSARTKCIAQCKNEIPPASLEYRWQFSLRRLISTARGWPPLSSLSSSTCLLANDPPTVYIKLPAELDTRHAIPARRESLRTLLRHLSTFYRPQSLSVFVRCFYISPLDASPCTFTAVSIPRTIVLSSPLFVALPLPRYSRYCEYTRSSLPL